MEKEEREGGREGGGREERERSAEKEDKGKMNTAREETRGDSSQQNAQYISTHLSPLMFASDMYCRASPFCPHCTPPTHISSLPFM